MHIEPAQWDGNVLGGLSLVLSNIALVPAIWLLGLRNDTASGAVLVMTFVASVLYHSCRAGFFCLAEYRMHVLSDYLWVYIGIVWLVTSLPFRPLKYAGDAQLHALFFFVLVSPIVFCILFDVPHYYQPLVGLALPFAFVIVFSLLHNGNSRRRLFRRRTGTGWAIAAAVSLTLAGVFMYALPMSTYAVSHTLWHVFSMLGSYFVVRARAY